MMKRLKNWILSVYQKVQKSNDDVYIEKLEELNDIIDKLDSDVIELLDIIQFKDDRITTLMIERDSWNETINEPDPEKPDWLIGSMRYTPKRRFVSKTKDVTIPFEKPQYCFDKSTILYDLLKENNLLKVEKTYNNMKKVMQLITKQLTYENDKSDNWRGISDVLMFKYGDCDDLGGIAITSALGMAGWKEDETFCWVGWYYPKGKSVDPNNKLCHAWNITKCDGVWYILEGTDSRAVPRLWKELKDKYVGNLGGCNWKFDGIIKGNKTYI